MSDFRPRLPHSESWIELIDLAKEQGASKILSALYGKDEIEFNEQENKISSLSERIRTLDDLIQSANVDLDVYEIERYKVNSWEVTSWKTGKAETKTNFQVTAWLKNRYFNKIDSDTVQQIIGTNADLLPKISKRNSSGKPLVCSIADLHAGGFTENMKLVPDYNLEVLREKLSRISQILRETNRPVHVKILGDLIESFTGKNHKDTWRQIEMHGMKVMFTVADMIIKLCNETPNIESLSIISGNHDRISSANDDDTEGQVAYGVAELLKRSGIDVTFDPLVLSEDHGGINYILLHGHLPISKKSADKIVLDYGKQDMYNVILKAHKHNQKILQSTTKLTVHQVPSLVPANEFAERLGEHAPTGIMLYEANDVGSVDFKTICV